MFPISLEYIGHKIIYLFFRKKLQFDKSLAIRYVTRPEAHFYTALVCHENLQYPSSKIIG
jgi:hypothetical protein